MCRSRILLLRRGRPVDHVRRRPGRACQGRAREARSGRAVEGRARLRDPCPEGLPDLRQRLCRAGQDHPWLARRNRELPAGRPQRPPPPQQFRPLDADRDARGRQPAGRRTPRHLGGKRRERLPRVPRGRRAAVPCGARATRAAGPARGPRPGQLTGPARPLLSPRAGRVLLVAAILAAGTISVLLSWRAIYRSPLNVDEELTLFVSHNSFGRIFHIVSSERGGGPFHFWIEHITLGWSNSLPALRGPSLAFFLLALPGVGLVALELAGAEIAAAVVL